MRRLLLCLVFVAACAPEPIQSVTHPRYTALVANGYGADGVGSATCPTASALSGGGCRCKGIGDPLFSGRPAGNSWVCGCYGSGAVDVYATCILSDTPGTMIQGLVAPDAEALELMAELLSQKNEGSR
jgi:hypothetical protein